MKTQAIERPARPAGAINLAELARQTRERERTLARLAGLRKRAADEIDRLLAFLDASDPYVTTELEDAVDDVPCDEDELEMGWAGVNAGHQPGGVSWLDEAEGDGSGGEADLEPSLGWTCGEAAARRYAMSDREDDAGDCPEIENEHRDDSEQERNLGWTAAEAASGDYGWASGRAIR